MKEPVRIICDAAMSCLGEGVVPCDVPCEWALKGSVPWENEADAIVSGILGGNTGVLEPNSKKVIWSMEGQCHYGRLKTAEKEVNQTLLLSAMLMQFSSPIPMPYFSWVEYDLQDWMPDYEAREKAVVFIAKNCNSLNGREQLVRGLIKHGVRVDAVSSCLNNKEWPADVPRNHKHGVLKKYLVYLAAENCNEVDYVSEKVYGALAAGSVPIYLGAPNIYESTFVPPNSLLIPPTDMNNDALVAAFAAEVSKVINNKAEWEAKVAWRQQPLTEEYKRKFAFTCTHSSCRLCRYAYAKKHGLGWNHELQRIEHPGFPTSFSEQQTFEPH